MTNLAVTLELPGDLYERIQHIALQSQRSIDELLVETMRLQFDPALGDLPIAALDVYSDQQLWALVAQTMVWPQKARFQGLVEQNKSGHINEQETTELDALLVEVDQYTLLRSKALVLLGNRGYSVRPFLHLAPDGRYPRRLAAPGHRACWRILRILPGVAQTHYYF